MWTGSGCRTKRGGSLPEVSVSKTASEGSAAGAAVAPGVRVSLKRLLCCVYRSNGGAQGHGSIRIAWRAPTAAHIYNRSVIRPGDIESWTRCALKPHQRPPADNRPSMCISTSCVVIEPVQARYPQLCPSSSFSNQARTTYLPGRSQSKAFARSISIP